MNDKCIHGFPIGECLTASGQYPEHNQLAALRKEIDDLKQELLGYRQGRAACCDMAREAEAKLLTEKMRRINEYADAERIVAWMSDPGRIPAMTAFREGPERQVAYAFEGMLSKAYDESIRLRKIIEGLAVDILVGGKIDENAESGR